MTTPQLSQINIRSTQKFKVIDSLATRTVNYDGDIVTKLKRFPMYTDEDPLQSESGISFKDDEHKWVKVELGFLGKYYDPNHPGCYREVRLNKKIKNDYHIYAENG